MYYLLILLVLVLLYKFYSLREGFYNSINPCFSKDTPYIMFDNMYVCFDNKNKIEDTLTSFYGKEKSCFIDPKNTVMTFYDINGKINDVITQKSNKICKPYKVNVE
jgi:hypothetical protein